MIDRDAVFAARRGLNVDAMTETIERIRMIISRFHSGQFYHWSLWNPGSDVMATYQGVVRVIAGLRDKYDSAASVIFQSGILLSSMGRPAGVIVYKGGAFASDQTKVARRRCRATYLAHAPTWS